MSKESSLLELTMLKEAGLIDNSNNPTDNAANVTPLRPYMPRSGRHNLYEIFDGEERRRATPRNSLWWKMYVEHPMLNVPKFHRVFCCRFRLPYALFIQFVSDAKHNHWFPRWNRWNSTSPLELLIFGGFHCLGHG